jgi:hypothetical protein
MHTPILHTEDTRKSHIDIKPGIMIKIELHMHIIYAQWSDEDRLLVHTGLKIHWCSAPQQNIAEDGPRPPFGVELAHTA